jgi:hypothetical protein
MLSNNNLVTIGSLIKKDLKQAYLLPALPFLNNKKYRVFNYPPSSSIFNNFLYPFRNLPAAGNEVPVLVDHQPPPFLKHHWKKWLPTFPSADLKTVAEGLHDDIPIVTTAAMELIPVNKHSVDPDVLYKLQLKSSIPDIGVPCPKYMSEDAVSFPCMMKVDMSSSGRGNRLARNKNELSANLKELKEECGWLGNIIFQEMMQGIKEVPNPLFYLHKSGEIHWIGTSIGGFDGFSFTSAAMDWDKQEEYKDLLYDEFTVPIKNYLHKQGFFGLVNYEVLRTEHGMYLVDLNPRLSAYTTHSLLAPYMAQQGFKHSCLTLKNAIHLSSAKTLIEIANDINTNSNTGRVIVLSIADVEKGSCYELCTFAKSPEEVEALHAKLTNA